MYIIVCTQLDNEVVKLSFEALANDTQNVLPHTEGNFVLITDNMTQKQGNGGSGKNVLVILGHGSPQGVSGSRTYQQYLNTLDSPPNIDDNTQIWVLSCSTARETEDIERVTFAYGNFARSVKDTRKSNTVWASETAVNARTLEGDWVRL